MMSTGSNKTTSFQSIGIDETAVIFIISTISSTGFLESITLHAIKIFSSTLINQVTTTSIKTTDILSNTTKTTTSQSPMMKEDNASLISE
ncbi:unnamed protein product [Rotaria sp. Silwood2]|nr:unnamed protein product [Rotaria sp. Silwood2]CAF2840201.1 unnamed protein product [Rotaria sp. Silwood2]CAF3049848.1 unnamed protein product [Rotaria sp. Silwood2]CAF3205597.1 unnamed protein product [Rotaria sp. Silwood2]CAF4225384.1 unnamed protein product [Rotaria sp. Silwood2]